jgi:hypothetical protein
MATKKVAKSEHYLPPAPQDGAAFLIYISEPAICFASR